jgi:hypothetical protein
MDGPKVMLINLPLWYYQSAPVDLMYAAYQLDINRIDYLVRDLNTEALEYLCNQYDKDIITMLNNRDTFYDITKLKECYKKLNSMFQNINHNIVPNKLGINFYESEIDIRNLDEIIEKMNRKDVNPYITFFEHILPGLFMNNVKFIAISIYHPDQLIPLFTFADLVKKQNPNIYIHVFGNLEDQVNTKLLFSNITEEISTKIGKYIDSVGIGSAHENIVDLYKKIIEEKECTAKKSSLYIEEGHGRDTFKLNRNILSNIPHSRFMPEDILNTLSSQGCYWGKCSYCSIRKHSRYMKKITESILEDLREVAANGDYSIVRFRDCCISPIDLNRIADQLLVEKIKISWCCRARFEKDFSSELFRKLKLSGCMMLSFGIESFDKDTLLSMNKGIDPTEAKRIIKSCHDAGIAVKLTAIVGYPTETYKQAEYNLNMLKEVTPYCVDIKCNPFILFDNTEMSSYPEKFNVIKKDYTNNQVFRYYCNYKIKEEDNQIKSGVLDEKIKQINQGMSAFLSEEHLLLYLQKYGLKQCLEYIHS